MDRTIETTTGDALMRDENSARDLGYDDGTNDGIRGVDDVERALSLRAVRAEAAYREEYARAQRACAGRASS